MLQALIPVLQFKLKGILVFDKIIKKNVTFVFGAEFFMYALNIFFPHRFSKRWIYYTKITTF